MADWGFWFCSMSAIVVPTGPMFEASPTAASAVPTNRCPASTSCASTFGSAGPGSLNGGV
jgi:hypothetical protein